MMRILVGMSGGLDSTYAALKLKSEGHEVEGAVVDMHEYADVAGARESAHSLGIKLHVIDARGLFEAVKENFVSEYSSGRTPNPCVVCNPLVKFRALADFAVQNGFDKIATGHYARVVTVEADGKILHTLSRAADQKKDQSYMLYRLPESILSMLILPLADEVKSDIRRKALGVHLGAAERKESQEICFIPSGDYAEYIEGVKGRFPEGDFILEDGTPIGRHKGIIHYTVGQRKGLGIAYGERIFVSRIDPVTNRITLSTEGSFTDTVSVSDVVFSGMTEPREPVKRRVFVKLRYLARPLGALAVFDGKGSAVLKLDSPEKAVTPGQSAVMYDGDVLLAGGFID